MEGWQGQSKAMALGSGVVSLTVQGGSAACRVAGSERSDGPAWRSGVTNFRSRYHRSIEITQSIASIHLQPGRRNSINSYRPLQAVDKVPGTRPCPILSTFHQSASNRIHVNVVNHLQ